MSHTLHIAGLYIGVLTELGGWQVFLHNFLDRLVDRGHEVDLYGPSTDAGRLARDPVERGYRVHPILPRRLVGTLAPIPRAMLRIAAARRRTDIWQVVGAYPAGHVAAGLRGPPRVLRAHGSDVQMDREIGYGMRLDPKYAGRIGRAVRSMDRVVALSPAMAESFRELGVPASRIVIIPNGVDLDRFGRAVDRSAVLARFGVDPGKPVVLSVGRNHRKKGFDGIPVMAKRLRTRGLSFTWLVVGPGVSGLEPAVARERAGDCVRLIEGDAVADGAGPGIRLPGDGLVGLYRAADIFVFPTLLEGFPRVLAEAMAAGLAIVTTDAPGAGGVLEPETEGLVVSVGDAEAMVATIARLLEDPSLRHRLGRAAAVGAGRYGWDRVLDAYEALYRELLGSGSGR